MPAEYVAYYIGGPRDLAKEVIAASSYERRVWEPIATDVARASQRFDEVTPLNEHLYVLHPGPVVKEGWSDRTVLIYVYKGCRRGR